MLVDMLAELNKKYSIILVTLGDENHFTKETITCDKKFNLGFKNRFQLFSCIIKLKKIIKKYQPSLIHSHLYYSSLISRISCPAHIPLTYSLHNEMSKSVFNSSKILTFLERKTIKENHVVIAVSKKVLEDYEHSIRKIKRSFVLPNFVSDKFFIKINAKIDFAPPEEIKLVAVGNIKNQKNYNYLVKAFENLKEYPISLDIYGQGSNDEFETLQTEINKNKLPIILKGRMDNVQLILSRYHLYVSCSKYEGFGIAAIEAMACGLPLLLSDLPVYHEITFENALFFDVHKTESFVTLIKEIFKKKCDLNELSNQGIDIAKKYTKEIYLNKLFTIYDKSINYSN